MKEYVIAVDIAKKRDYTALMVFRDNPTVVDGIKRLEQPDKILHYYDVVHIEKFQGLTYPQISKAVGLIANHRDLSNNHDLLVDGTGVGEAVIDILRASGYFPVPIVFTGGARVNEVHEEAGKIFGSSNFKLAPLRVVKEIHVPKADLVSAGSLLVQQARVRVVPDIPWAQDFKKQLMSFTGKVNETTRRVKYEAETENDHDDLVVCFLMASWWFTHRRKEQEETVIPEGNAMENTGDWNPYDFA